MNNKYIIKSTSHIIISNEIKRITKDIDNVSYFSMNDTELDDIIVDASYFGFLDTAKAIVITDFTYFGDKFKHEEESNKIIEFLKNLDERCTVIFVAASVDAKKDFTSNVLALGVELLDFSNLSKETIKNNVDTYVIDNKLILDNNAYQEIYNRTKGYLDIIIEEIKKLSLIDKHITLAIVNEYGSNYMIEPYNQENNYDDIIWKFYDSVTSKNFKVIFELLDELLARGEEYVTLISGIFNQYLPIYIVKCMNDNHESKETIMKVTGYTDKRIFMLDKKGRIYTKDDLENILLKLTDIDIKSKSGYDIAYMFKQFLIEL